jgi:hypothetical protein
MAKKKHFPNNWQAYKDSPDQFFLPLEFDEFMDWKINGWEIPSSVACIIREQDIKTGKVTEHVYSRLSNANKRANKIMKEGKSEFLVCTHDDIGHIYPKRLNKEDSIYDNYDSEAGADWFDDKLREENEP